MRKLLLEMQLREQEDWQKVEEVEVELVVPEELERVEFMEIQDQRPPFSLLLSSLDS